MEEINNEQDLRNRWVECFRKLTEQEEISKLIRNKRNDSTNRSDYTKEELSIIDGIFKLRTELDELRSKINAIEKYKVNIKELTDILSNEILFEEVLVTCTNYNDSFTKDFFKKYNQWLAFIIGLNKKAVDEYKVGSFLRNKFPKVESYYSNNKYVDNESARNLIKLMIKKDKKKIVEYFIGFVRSNTGYLIGLLKFIMKNNCKDLCGCSDTYWEEKYGKNM